MAQTNFTPILTYKSDTASAVPSAANLTNSTNGAELAVNTADKRLFTKDSGGNVVEIGTNPSSLSLPNGTANGVVYANGSKVLTTGSALTFNGTFLQLSGAYFANSGAVSNILAADATSAFFDTSSSVYPFRWLLGGSEQMRLTSTGLGIGTSSPTAKLQVNGNGTVSTTDFYGSTFTTKLQAASGTSVQASLAIMARGPGGANSGVSIHAVKSATSDDYRASMVNTITGDGIGQSYWAVNNFNPTGASTSELMRLTYAGNLGIGTSSPATKLHLSDATNPTIRLQDTTYTGRYIDIAYNQNGVGEPDLVISRAVGGSPSTLATLDYNGNLGLGVTPSAWTAAGKTFEIGSAGNLVYGGPGYIGNSQNAYFNSGWKYGTSTGAARYEINNSTHQWFTAPSGTAGNAISFSQVMTLDASGNLLVGTTNGIGKLAVATASGTGSASTWDNTFVTIAPGGTSTSTGLAFSVNTSTNTSQITSLTPGISWRDLKYKASQHIWEFGASQTEAARITSGGDLLVGKTSTATNVAGVQIYVGTGGQVTVSKTASGSADALACYHSGTYVGGVVYSNTATSFPTSSDYRLKDNLQPLIGSGAFIDALQPKTWNWKADGSKGVGFIAHEVQAVSPGSVVGEKDAVDADGKPIMQAMEYGSAEFIANIIAELQSLRARVAALEAA